ncbi:MAG: glycosyltransferase family 2 protein [Candidatus Aminicenantes bacterium]|nr:glycosyltransferase family 2 protein [Candidatus Aminicenantes bacterium]
MNAKSPLISVVTATYNRSNVLYYSLSLLQKQEFRDWECIIVGDKCTDDTGNVVASFNENRFRFINLDENTGDQAGPNNYGCRLARGKYIAFLNHDDLWFPDHLSSMLQTMDSRNADLVYAMSAIVFRDENVLVKGINEDGIYEPNIFVPASAWLFRREMLESVGSWKSFKQTHCTPSQDWIVRSWKKKNKIIMNPRLTVLMVYSGLRPDSYKDREFEINKKLCNLILDNNGYRNELILRSLIESAGAESSMSFRKNMKRLIRGVVYKVLIKMGIPPLSVLNFIKYGIHGGFIQYLRVKRGLGKK